MAKRDDKLEKDDAKTTPPAMPPPIISAAGRGGRRLPPTAVYLILALVVVLAVVLGGRWLYDRAQDEPDGQPSPPPSETTRPPATEPEEADDGQEPSGQQPTRQPDTGPTAQQESAAGELADTGPGSTAAIFVGTTLAVGALHYVVQLRRAS